jgi:hypothetical protein
MLGVKPGHRKKILLHASQSKPKKSVPSLTLNTVQPSNSAASTPRKRLSSPGPLSARTTPISPSFSPTYKQSPRAPTSPTISPTKVSPHQTISHI